MDLNKNAWKLIEKLLEDAGDLMISHTEQDGAILIDAGMSVPGSIEAGILVTKICLGGYGAVTVDTHDTELSPLGKINVMIEDRPAIPTLASQFAGWRVKRKYLKIKEGKEKEKTYFAMGSGPARSIPKEPKNLYEKLEYEEQSTKAVLVLETSKSPPKEAIDYVLGKTQVDSGNLAIVCAPTNCLVGSVQIAGRIVETAIHKAKEVGLNPQKISHGEGTAPVAPIAKDPTVAMGITNDAIIYHGQAKLEVSGVSEEDLAKITAKTASSSSRDYGKPFFEIFKEANYDFFKIDAGLFAPAKILIRNLDTNVEHVAGELNSEVLRRAFQAVE
ncbi:MAG: methenyltetrahydromethanopterin cyclohydrolase [Candidatus Heimdallarchaeota archaeon]